MIISEFPPPYGGMSVQAALLVKKLNEEGLSVTPINYNYLPEWATGIPILKTILKFLIYLVEILLKGKKVDTLHVFSNSYLNFFLFTIPAVFVSKIYRKNCIIHYHGGGAASFFLHWMWLIRPIFKLADTILVPSGFLQEIFSKYKLKTEVVPNIMELGNSSVQITNHSGNGKPITIIINRHLEPIYNIKCAIDAVEILINKGKNVILTVLGGGSQFEELLHYTKTKKLEAKIIFEGEVPSKQIETYFKNADIFLNTSLFDNQPVAILEAFAYGLPVVTTNVGGIPHMVNDGENGLLVPPNDPHTIASKIIELMEDRNLYETIVENGFKSIQKYQWSELVNNYFKLYNIN